MGQKIHPYGLRLGIVTDWKSRWYSEKDYASQVAEDHKIRAYLKGELKRGAISRIDIERIGDKKVQIDIHTGRPGVVIGRGGSEAERLRSGLEKLSGRMVKFNVIEVHNPEMDATLLARSVADQLEGRVSFRRALKRTVSTALKAGAEGVRVQASGRLGGADMGRREWYLEGRVPLHTLRADIDFGQATAETTVGAIGIKVWVYKGDIMLRSAAAAGKAAAEARLATGGTPDRTRRKSVKSRAEAAAGGSERRIIEAGGGKRVVEAGGGKPGKRLIEAGGGKRVPTAADAKAELQEAREAAEVAEDVATEAIEQADSVAANAEVAAAVADEVVASSAADAVIAEVAEAEAAVADAEAVVAVEAANEAAEEAAAAEVVAEEAIAEAAAAELDAEIAEEAAEEAVAEAVAADVVAEVAEEAAEEAGEEA